MTGLLHTTDLSQQQQEYVDMIRTSAEMLLAIINDILDFSKIEAGKLELETLDFDLEICLEEVSDIVAFKAQSKGLEYYVYIDPSVPLRLRGDPNRFKQVCKKKN
jgi:signal transduction histidine kinase